MLEFRAFWKLSSALLFHQSFIHAHVIDSIAIYSLQLLLLLDHTRAYIT